MLTIRHVLEAKDKNIWTVDAGATAYDALEIMADKDIGAVLVMDGGRLAGIFSERDYARKVILHGKSSRDTPVSELMTTEVYSLTPEKNVEECMALMSAAHCRHMPVMENGEIIGLVTIGDVVNALIAEKQITINDLKHYITGSEYDSVADNP